MFTKILIANRGEIAVRVMRTAKRMGISTVAVYSDADQDSLAVRMADEAVRLGPPAARESYLAVDKVLAAIEQTGADAVHPGYGFLSENAAFARTLSDAGVAFIGPPPDAIAAMGDKIESKKLADAAGVNTIPGHLGVIEDADAATEIAGGIGYPVMIKASAGGGGKGMRIARRDGEVADGFRSAQNEARSSFGDDRVFIEKYIEEPRHIEIQVLADSHGNIIHLGERECSIQRRHQKVIEESPSPALDPQTRAAMGAQACALARAVDYRSAGTVEFIVDRARNFYFLEMNTRLQVEHPVTEMVTGLDLVELMIRIAAGEPLPLSQDDVGADGWAIEARVYAEDPSRNFLPAIGRLARYILPDTADGAVRIDTGVVEGSDISMYYDPMIAKLVTHGVDRSAAIDQMRAALDAYYIRGTGHNMAFLASVLAHPRFAEGRLSTDFIAEEYPDGYIARVPEGAMCDRFVAVAAFVHARIAARARQIGRADFAGDGRQSQASAGPPAAGKHLHYFTVWIGGDVVDVAVHQDRRAMTVEIGERKIEVLSDWQIGEALFAGEIGEQDATFQVDRQGIGYRLTHGGAEAHVKVLSRRASHLNALMPEKVAPDLSKFLQSPMPGLLVSLAVGEGIQVRAGDELAVVEAMKMENILHAATDGTVKKIHAAPGESLAVDQAILEFE